MQQIALFGTSADPPTIGHQTILNWLSQHFDRVVVWASDNPFKQHQTPLKDRTAMLNLAIAELKSRKNISIHPELSDRWTLITVNRARAKWGEEVEFSLVVGADIINQLSNWYRIEELLKQVKLLIVPRRGYNINGEDLAELEQIGARCAIATFNAPRVASSTYRLEKDQTLITPAVKNYIWEHNLYGEV
ncbi:nicotinic acid mononucleotide adenyltransferase [Chondrocystis sp. NIES-4102]|nr:nicotinic acid mononucleotide adenyltransferase [Chondrocystis sp. NIES-4102]